MIKLFNRRKSKINHNEDYANVVLDFTPNPQYAGTYDITNGRIILRVGNFEGDEMVNGILWTLLHESIHITLYNRIKEIYDDKPGPRRLKVLNHEWYQVAGMDYLEDVYHEDRLTNPMSHTYSKIAPKAWEFRKTFDVNFLLSSCVKVD
jgi:hypothetical protein